MKNQLIGRSKEQETETIYVKKNEHSLGLIDKALTMDVLFGEE